MTPSLSRRALLSGFALGAIAVPLAGAATAQAAMGTISFTVPLTGAAQVPPVKTAGHGSAHLIYDEKTRHLTWSVSYSGLSSPVTMAHFHMAPAGKNGKVVLWISKKGGKIKSPLKGSATLTPAEAKAFMAGDLYINVHSKKHPAGELRGQVKPPM
jgi:hypothetical protein